MRQILNYYITKKKLCIYIYIYIQIFQKNIIVRLSYPRSGDSQTQKMCLAPSADKQTRNYDTDWSNLFPYQSL